MTQALTAVGRRQRVVAIDALRGVALFGILLVNVQYFQGPEPFAALGTGEAWQGADRIAALAIAALVEGKFITGFALLFGLGIAIQTDRFDRTQAGGRSSGALLVRRLAVLAVFGAVHAFLIWYGDVLLIYAVLGFVLLAFRTRAPRTLLIWAVALYALSALFISGWRR